MRSALGLATAGMLLLACGSKSQRTTDGPVEGPGPGTGGAGGAGAAPSPADGAAGAEAGAADPFTTAIEAFCRQKALKVCARNAACSYNPVSETDCRATTEADCRAEMDAGPARSAAAGRLKVDEAAFARCLAAHDRFQCAGATYDVLPQCQRLFTGTIADGQPCLNKHECVGGICTRTDTCPGTCASFGAIGADCGLPNTIACDPRTSVCDQTLHKCTAAPDVACTTVNPCPSPGTQGQSCDLTDNVYCQAGLACVPAVSDGGEGLAGTCGPRVPEGSKCFSECQPGLACVPDDPDAGAFPGTCRPLAKLGQACGSAGCVHGTRCDDSGKCGALPPCTSFRDATCTGRLPVGGTCSSSLDCASFVCVQRKCLAACSVSDL
jgi:hypothetical protein